MSKIKQLVFLGSGNVAWHLSHAFQKAGIQIVQIYSRNEDHARELATSLQTNFTANINALANADAYIFALTDSAILPILETRKWNQSLLIHLAGSVEKDIFKSFTDSYGVMYPLQSFSKGSSLNISEIPFLIEGNNLENESKIFELAGKISNNRKIINSDIRSKIHLSAVFASNYVNYMLGIATQFLEKERIDSSLLHPLINETIKKALEIGPIAAQTGPARRNNRNILKKHELMLESNPDWQKLYTFVAEKITTFYQQYDGKF